MFFPYQLKNFPSKIINETDSKKKTKPGNSHYNLSSLNINTLHQKPQKPVSFFSKSGIK